MTRSSLLSSPGSACIWAVPQGCDLASVASDVGPAPAGERWAVRDLGFRKFRYAPADQADSSLPVPRTTGLLLAVTAGPDAGSVWPLHRGANQYGRGSCRLSVSDTSTSRAHATFRVTSGGVELREAVQDARVFVDGRRTPAAVVDETHELRIGSNTLRVLPRAPRAVSAPAQPLVLEDVPASFPGVPWMALVGAVAPVAVGLLLWRLTGMWFMLIFGALGVLTGGANVIMDAAARRRVARQVRTLAEARGAVLRSAFPDAGTAAASLRRRARATERGPIQDLPLRCGTWPRGALRPPARSLDAGSGRRLPGRRHLQQKLPALATLSPGDRLAVIGPPEKTHAAVRSLLLSWLATGASDRWHARVPGASFLPASVAALPGVEYVAPDAADHSQDGTVPPERAGAATSVRTIAFRREPGPAGPTHPRRDPIDGCVEVSWQSDETATWVLDLQRNTLSHDGEHWPIEPDLISVHALDAACQRALDTLPWHPLSADPDAAPSLDAPRGLPAAVGTAAVDGDPVELDLVAQGPHALVAGTTGSGKSEFLRTWLLQMCERTPPTRLRLVLIDFKGGAAFQPLRGLPHVDLLSTDLDGHETSRIVQELTSEIRRREEWVLAQGATDLEDCPDSADRPPRLLVVIDEFRILAEQHPKVLDRLVRVAAVGRSLGLHLILSTQRPQGIVSPEIRANISLVVGLRMTSEYESTELLGTPAAAQIAPAHPGRGYVRAGNAAPLCFDVRSTATASGAPSALRIGPTLADARPVPLRQKAQPGLEERIRQVRRRHVGPVRPVVSPGLPQDVLDMAAIGTGSGLALGLRQHPCAPRNIPWVWDPSRSGPLAVTCGSPESAGDLAAAWIARAARSPRHAARSLVFDGAGLASRVPAALRSRLGAWVTPADGAWADDLLEQLSADKAGGPWWVWFIRPSAWWGDLTDPRAMRREGLVRTYLLRSRSAAPGSPGPAVSPADTVPGFIAIGDRDVCASRALAAISSQAHLPYGSRPEMTALWPEAVPRQGPRGRAWLSGSEHATPLEVQCPTASSGLSRHGRTDTRSAAFKDLPEAWSLTEPDGPSGAEAELPGRHASLPVLVSPDCGRASWTPGRLGLIVGPAGSGKTSAARLLSCAPGVRWMAGSLTPDIGQPTGAPRGHEAETWVVDDLDRLTPSEVDVVADFARSGGHVIATAKAGARLAYQVPFWDRLDPERDMLVLGPRHRDDIAFPGWEHRASQIHVDPQAPPGRAYGMLTHADGSSDFARCQVAHATPREPGMDLQAPRGASSASR